jgi:hypothetical protein
MALSKSTESREVHLVDPALTAEAQLDIPLRYACFGQAAQHKFEINVWQVIPGSIVAISTAQHQLQQACRSIQFCSKYRGHSMLS